MDRRVIAGLVVVLVTATALVMWTNPSETEGKEDLEKRRPLRSLGLDYHRCAGGGISPTSLEYFLEYLELADDGAPSDEAIAARKVRKELLASGDIVLIWNADLSGGDKVNEASLLGHYADAATNGGWVLMADGSTRIVTPEEFANLPTVPTSEPSPEQIRKRDSIDRTVRAMLDNGAADDPPE